MRTSSVWDDGVKPGMSSDLCGPYIDAPVWPWSVAGWTFAALYILLALMAWISS